jgi:hypothetical protein
MSVDELPYTHRWADWTARDPDGWLCYYDERPWYEVRIMEGHLMAGWRTRFRNGRSRIVGEHSYREYEASVPWWWWQKGPLPWFVWVIVARFTLRRIR